MRLAWLTDIHFNFVDAGQRRRFLDSLDPTCDAVAISGDIGESRDVAGFLGELQQSLERPIYFVLGNHDFYRGSVAETRAAVARLAAESKYLVYLTDRGPVELTPQTALIGHDGWADARLGDFETSDVILNDYVLIAELRHWTESGTLDKERLRAVLQSLGDEAARHFEANLEQAVIGHRRLIALTHVPPFREATWYAGRHSNDHWLPHFACKAVGEVLLKVMRSHPECQLLVLCGHTHGEGETRPLDNLRVLTGGATYGEPAIQRIVDVV